MLVKPSVGTVYNVCQIYNDLFLRDSPALRINLTIVEGVDQEFCIQDSEEGIEKTLEVLKNLKFRYDYETPEWIPVFTCVSDVMSILKALDFEVDLSGFASENNLPSLLAWPKGTTFKQYYRLLPDEKTTTCQLKDGEETNHLDKYTVAAIQNLKAWKASNSF